MSALSDPPAPSNFAVHYKPDILDFDLSLFSVYDNVGENDNFLRTIFKTLTTDIVYQIVPETLIIDLGVNEYDFSVKLYFYKVHEEKTNEHKTTIKSYINAITNYIKYLFENNPDWWKLMNKIKSENPDVVFEFKFDLFNRPLSLDFVHKDMRFLVALTYLNSVESTPEISFSQNEVPKNPYRLRNRKFPESYCETTGVILKNFTEKEQIFRDENGCVLYRYDISNMKMPTIAFSDWLLYHATPSDSLSREIDYGAQGDLLKMNFEKCNGRICTQLQPAPRKMFRFSIFPVDQRPEAEKFVIIEKQSTEATTSHQNVKIPNVVITDSNFSEALTSLKNRPGIFTSDECQIASNRGGKKLIIRKKKTKRRKTNSMVNYKKTKSYKRRHNKR
jgi:hypothetical protein